MNAIETIKEAMKTVIQEMVLCVDDQYYLVYIHDIGYENGKFFVDFTCMDQDLKDFLYPHVVACLQSQISEISNETQNKILTYVP